MLLRCSDALGIERAHVVGASMGGMIGQIIAYDYPQRTQSLVSIMSTTWAEHFATTRASARGGHFKHERQFTRAGSQFGTAGFLSSCFAKSGNRDSQCRRPKHSTWQILSLLPLYYMAQTTSYSPWSTVNTPPQLSKTRGLRSTRTWGIIYLMRLFRQW